LNAIKIYGGGDCPELALQGLEHALQNALPGSLAYVISDASAKDYSRYNAVYQLMQRRQATVNFLLTGFCSSKTDEKYLVFDRLSKASNGLIFNMKKTDIHAVLKQLNNALDSEYSVIKNIISTGQESTSLNIDGSVKQLSVSVSGTKPQVTVKNPTGSVATPAETLNLDSVKIVKFNDPAKGTWTIETSAGSEYSTRVEAISKIKFEFGFSLVTPDKKSKTDFQPLKNVRNVLSIFINDPSDLNNLTEVRLCDKTPGSVETCKLFALEGVRDDHYVTEAFVIPYKDFKLEVLGSNKDASKVERVLSTDLHGTTGSKKSTSFGLVSQLTSSFLSTSSSGSTF